MRERTAAPPPPLAHGLGIVTGEHAAIASVDRHLPLPRLGTTVIAGPTGLTLGLRWLDDRDGHLRLLIGLQLQERDPIALDTLLGNVIHRVAYLSLLLATARERLVMPEATVHELQVARPAGPAFFGVSLPDVQLQRAESLESDSADHEPSGRRSDRWRIVRAGYRWHVYVLDPDFATVSETAAQLAELVDRLLGEPRLTSRSVAPSHAGWGGAVLSARRTGEPAPDIATMLDALLAAPETALDEHALDLQRARLLDVLHAADL